jgi:hypothetical protein
LSGNWPSYGCPWSKLPPSPDKCACACVFVTGWVCSKYPRDALRSTVLKAVKFVASQGESTSAGNKYL